jgi:streptogramin lyase
MLDPAHGDLDGNIWVSSGGSFDGAYCWDGSQWKHFPISRNEDGARFHKIRNDHHGRLWFLGLPKFKDTPSIRGPGVFVYENGHFSPWGKDHGVQSRRIFAFDDDDRGRLWFGTVDGIIRWDQEKWQRWQCAQGLRRARVFTLAVDHHGNCWFGHQFNGLGLGCIDSSGQVRYYMTSDGLVNDDVWEVRVDSLGGWRGCQLTW